MIPSDVLKEVHPDSSAAELKQLAEQSGCALSELYRLRRKAVSRYNVGVSYYSRKVRRGYD